MKYRYTLYVDNFRGFQDTFVPLSDVNFLVGENSTGKTSVLSLLKLLGTRAFLTQVRFSDEDEGVDLGTYDDILSAGSTDKSSFRVGMVRRPPRALPMAMLVTYEKHEGLPRDAQFICTYGKKELTVVRTPTNFYYRVSDANIGIDTDIEKLLSGWLERPIGLDDSFKKLAGKFSPEYQSLLYPLSFVSEEKTIENQNQYALLNPIVYPPAVWVSPVRTKPRRTYDALRSGFSSDGNHTPYLIRRMFESKEHCETFFRSINAVGKASGLFESVEIRKFGDDMAAPFELRIKLNEASLNITTVGYGVSQALPILAEAVWQPSGREFIIQQPEVHLHPRAQAALGDLFFTLARREHKRFLIETHSDFLIDRYRSNFRQKVPRHSSQVLFFERQNRMNKVTALPMAEDGGLSADQPKAYRDFFKKENLRVLDF